MMTKQLPPPDLSAADLAVADEIAKTGAERRKPGPYFGHRTFADWMAHEDRVTVMNYEAASRRAGNMAQPAAPDWDFWHQATPFAPADPLAREMYWTEIRRAAGVPADTPIPSAPAEA